MSLEAAAMLPVMVFTDVWFSSWLTVIYQHFKPQPSRFKILLLVNLKVSLRVESLLSVW